MEKMQRILNYFDELYPSPVCALNFTTPFELLVAVMLSAQCTDKRVNIVTEHLFKIANTPEKLIELSEKNLKDIIFPCGFYNSKSKALIETSKDLLNKYNGNVPSTLEDLTSLRGVGRKTANVVISVAFGGQTIAVDTHVHRVSKRLGLAKENSTPLECELSLLKKIPFNRRSKFHHQTIWFGRDICNAKNPKCECCKLKDICKYYKKHKRL